MKARGGRTHPNQSQNRHNFPQVALDLAHQPDPKCSDRRVGKRQKAFNSTIVLAVLSFDLDGKLTRNIGGLADSERKD